MGKNNLFFDFKEIQLTQFHALSDIFSNLFGYTLLVIGEEQFCALSSASRINLKIHLNCSFTAVHTTDSYQSLISRLDVLPIANNSIDVVHVAFCLEAVLNPYEFFREVYRCIVPEGHLVLSGVNWYSIPGIFKRFIGIFKSSQKTGPCYSVSRLCDWLQLLGFEIVLVSCPMNSFFYSVVAKKRVLTMTPVKPKWKVRPLAGDLINSTNA